MRVEDSGNKRQVIEGLLADGMVLVTLDARVTGVRVPGHLNRDPQLRLNLSYRFGLPMEIDAEGVNATLTFAGEPFACRIPWRAIYVAMAHQSGEPVLFATDVPFDAEAPPSPNETSGASLRVVRPPGEGTQGVSEPTQGDSGSVPTRRRGSHLRVIK